MNRSALTRGVVLSFLCAVLVLGAGAVSATAEPAADTLPTPVEAPPGTEIRVMAFERQSPIIVDVDMTAVTLTDGRALPGHGDISEVPKDVTDDTIELFAIFEAESESSLNGGAAYQIVMQGKPSGYWIEPSVRTYSYNTEWTYSCTVYHGDSEQGGTVPETSPFVCTSDLVNPGNSGENAEVLFHVGLNRAAEASGTVRTSDTISLSEGHFNTEQAYRVSGSSGVDLNSSTEFDSVLRNGEIPQAKRFRNQARTEFSYRINVDGRRTLYWAGGFVTNHHSDSGFTAESRCRIFKGNPLLGSESTLDDSINVPVTDSGFQCVTKGQFVSGAHDIGNIHYDATFTVKASPNPQ